MSYAAVFSGQIVIAGVPKEEWPPLVDLHEQLIQRYCGGEGAAGLVDDFLAFDTPWKTGRDFSGRPEEVECCDFQLEADGDRLLLVGTEYHGGTRHHQLRQINWLLAWLKGRYPDVRFSGDIIEHDAETDKGGAWAYVAGGDRAYLHATELVVAERMKDEEQ